MLKRKETPPEFKPEPEKRSFKDFYERNLKKFNYAFIASTIVFAFASIGTASNQASIERKLSESEAEVEQLNSKVDSLEDDNEELKTLNAELQKTIDETQIAPLLEEAKTHYNNQEYQKAKEVADKICSEYPESDAAKEAKEISTNSQAELDKQEQQRIEEKKRAEEERLLQEQQAQEQARLAQEAQQAQNSYSAATVYIAASGNGTKYHSNPNCSRMNGTISLTVSDAQARGYTPCKKCY